MLPRFLKKAKWILLKLDLALRFVKGCFSGDRLSWSTGKGERGAVGELKNWREGKRRLVRGKWTLYSSLWILISNCWIKWREGKSGFLDRRSIRTPGLNLQVGDLRNSFSLWRN